MHGRVRNGWTYLHFAFGVCVKCSAELIFGFGRSTHIHRIGILQMRPESDGVRRNGGATLGGDYRTVLQGCHHMCGVEIGIVRVAPLRACEPASVIQSACVQANEPLRRPLAQSDAIVV
jgi:hypothetical protein